MTSRGAWQAVRGRPRLAVSAGALGALLVSGAIAASLALQAAAPGSVAAVPPSPSQTPEPRPSAVTPAPTATPAPASTPTAAPTPSPTPVAASLLGADGRFTILLLGSDYRRGHAGNRTDTIMVISVDARSGAVAAASIPRDTVNFPLPDGSRFAPKINELYQRYISRMGVAKAGPAMSRTVGRALKVEIDNYVVIGFEGVKRLVNAVGGVDIVLPETIRDSAYWLSPTKRGVVFPAGKNHLNGERALIFARTRKADNDFERARRQQKLIAAAVASVRELGLGDLPELVAIARDYVKTDLPLARAPEIFEIVASAKTKKATGVVFGPRKWASSTSGASFALKIGEVRGWTRKWMAPVKAAPDATSTPAASTAP
jgi:polyisoprenyl-teichoic acid--peptidoglycan teichoic acid transferase